MKQLPKAKRFVITLFDTLLKTLFIATDETVAEFLNTLKCVENVTLWGNRYYVRLDHRFAYDDDSTQQTYEWIVEQLEMEFGETDMPSKPNIEGNEKP